MADVFGTYGNQDVESWRRIPTRDEPKIEAEPSFIQKLARSLANDPTAGASPNVIGGLSMKNPANAQKLLNIIRESNPEMGSGEYSPIKQALAYIRAKYPKLTGMVNTRVSDKLSNPNVLGEYDPESKIIAVSKDLPSSEGVDVLGHELTHSIQDLRSRMVPKRPNFSPGSFIQEASPQPIPSLSGPGLGRAGAFRYPEGVADKYSDANSLYGYENNPYEVQARKGGQTALDTYKKFNDYLIKGKAK